MKSTSGFHFQEDGDLDYLRAAYYLRVGTIDHLAALTRRSYNYTQKRAAQLYERGYLKPLTRPPQQILYGLGRQGVSALVHAGYAPDDLLRRRIRTKELSPHFLKHFMLVKDIQVKLTTEAQTPIEIAKWIEGPAIWDTVRIQEKQGDKTVLRRLPVRPDALFVIRDTSRPDGQNSMTYILEADRHKEVHEILRKKMRAYVQYIQEEKTKWECTIFRVLIVTEKDTIRAENLHTTLIQLIPPQVRIGNGAMRRLQNTRLPFLTTTRFENLRLHLLVPEAIT